MNPLTTRQQLKRVADNLFRHDGTAVYYGVKVVATKKKTKSLDTTDRAMANRRLKEWLDGLDAIDPGNRDATLNILLDRFVAARKGKSAGTITSESGMIAQFRKTFPKPMETLVTRVQHSHLVEWLALIKPGKRNSTYNRWRLFLRQLFELAEDDRMIPKSPFIEKRTPRAAKQRIIRHIPTEDQFVKIVAEIRKPSWVVIPGKRGGQRPAFQHESADFAAFLGLAGVGQAEACALTWTDIDEEKNQIHFLRQKTQKSFSIPIFAWLKPLLSEVAKRRKGAGDRQGLLGEERQACSRWCM